MQETYSPFFFNSNICLDENSCSTPKKFFDSVARNTGNSYITFALVKETLGRAGSIAHVPNAYEFDYSRSAEVADRVNSSCSHFFLVLQDQIRPFESYGYKLPYDRIISLLDLIKKPIVIAGLGANSLSGFDPQFHKAIPEDLANFVRRLADRTRTLGVRGEFTREVLHKLGVENARTIGCPSFFERGAARTLKKPDSPEKVFLTSPFENPNYGRFHVVLQDEDYLINPLCFTWRQRVRKTNYRKLRAGHFHAFSSIADWKKFAAAFDFAMGTRVHGAILSINSGTCAAVFNGDSRAREMCEFLRIPYLPQMSAEADVRKIFDAADFEPMNREYPRLFQNYREFLSQAGVPLLDNPPDDGEVLAQPSLRYNEGRLKNNILRKAVLDMADIFDYHIFP